MVGKYLGGKPSTFCKQLGMFWYKSWKHILADTMDLFSLCFFGAMQKKWCSVLMLVEGLQIFILNLATANKMRFIDISHFLANMQAIHRLNMQTGQNIEVEQGTTCRLPVQTSNVAICQPWKQN